MVKKSINIKNTNEIMMILDTNICTCLILKEYTFLMQMVLIILSLPSI